MLETRSGLIDARIEVRIGSRVIAIDGEVGRVQGVVVHPEKSRVQGLVLNRGLWADHSVLLTPEHVLGATRDEILLKIGRSQLNDLQAVNPKQYPRLAGSSAVHPKQSTEAQRDEHAEGWREPSNETQPIRMIGRQRVYTGEGLAGSVQRLLSDRTGKVHSFVLRRHSWRREQIIVPATAVHELNASGIYLSLQAKQLDEYPRYVLDEQLGDDLARTFWEDSLLGGIVNSGMNFTVLDGVVTLNGHASTGAIRLRAGDLASRVAGVIQVNNLLIPDDELSRKVGQALAACEQIPPGSVYVRADLGFVTLSGKVPNQSVANRLVESAAQVPEVRGVINSLQHPGTGGSPTMRRALQPLPGDRVFAADGSLGRIEQVVIDPRTRLVSALVVHGAFPDLGTANPGQQPYNDVLQKRRVEIPVETVQHASKGSVILKTSGRDTACFRDFEPVQYAVPSRDWRPPFPYRERDVFLVSYVEQDKQTK
jgi:sporulation protein YlmC with PRC-barrel domain